MNTFTKGMDLDVLPKHQTEGTYRNALNAVLETTSGQRPAISNELGNSLCSLNYPANKQLIGAAQTNTEEMVLFLFDPDTVHEIGLFNPDTCAYATLLSGECLSFSDKHPVNAIVRLVNGCDRMIYFTDNLNKYRAVNIDRVEAYHLPTTPGLLHCPRLDFTKDFNLPCIGLYSGISASGIEDNAGGSLEIGVYYFAVRFLDEFLNATEWTTITRPIAIADEPFANLFNEGLVNLYDGGSNVETSPFYVSKTNKTISMSVTGSSDVFTYYQMAVIKRTSDSGEISGVDVLKPKPWASSVIFTYDGDPTKVEAQISIEELLTPNVSLQKARAHAIKNDRLFVANTSIDRKDYSMFQQMASKVKTEWTKTAVSSSIDAQVKSGAYYNLNGSFMEDEVYALGIVYVFNDGSTSPVFHIPGRIANLIPVNGNNPFVGAAGVPFTGTNWDTDIDTYTSAMTVFPDLKRWRYVSTALSYGAGALNGLMGFHETETTYPNTPTCDTLVDGYWGRDWQGNLIVPGTTKIRHHRMPGPELRETAATAHGFRLGVRFTNVDYPANQGVVGHFFVYGDRTFNKTIQDKGIFIPLENEATLDYEMLKPKTYSTVDITTTNNYVFISANGLINNLDTAGSYMRIEKILRDLNYESGGLGAVTDTTAGSVIVDETSSATASTDTETTIRYFTRYFTPSQEDLFSAIQSSLYVQKAYPESLTGTEAFEPLTQKIFTNNSINNFYQVIHTDGGPYKRIVDDAGNFEGKTYFGSIKIYKDVFNDLYSIEYKRMNNCYAPGPNPLATYTLFGADTAVNRVSFLDFNYKQTGVPPASTTFEVKASYLSFLSQDTYLNYEFRHGSNTDLKNSYYQHKNTATMVTNHLNLEKYLVRKQYEIGGGYYALYPETYNYNKSFSFLDGFQIFYPVPFKYDFCSPCIEDHPYRVYYSEKGSQESLKDLSRIIRQNNYTDLNGIEGEITDLFVNFDALYATTTKSLYILPVNPQVLQTDLNSVFIGTAEVFGVPRELKNTAYGFGGQQLFTSRTNTQYGTFYIDWLSRKPFLLTTQLEDLSQIGVKSFWQENGDLKFLRQFESKTGSLYNAIATTSPVGVGYVTVYDPKLKRLLVHKKDFEILPAHYGGFIYHPQTADTPLIGGNVTPNALWYNDHSFYKNDIAGVPVKVIFDNTEIFENKSFTLSYSLESKYWTSFHSYLPSFLFGNSSTFFSTPSTVSLSHPLFKHNTGAYQTFYEDKYPHMVDLILKMNPLETKTSSSIFFTSKVTDLSPSLFEEELLDRTYTSFIGYNSKQSTGLQTLQPKTQFQLDTSSDIALIKEQDGYWRLNNLRDLSISPSSSVWDSSWSAKASFPYKFTDKEPNTLNLDYSKSLFEQARLKDHYFGGRFYFNPTENLKIVTDVITSTLQNKNR